MTHSTRPQSIVHVEKAEVPFESAYARAVRRNGEYISSASHTVGDGATVTGTLLDNTTDEVIYASDLWATTSGTWDNGELLVILTFKDETEFEFHTIGCGFEQLPLTVGGVPISPGGSVDYSITNNGSESLDVDLYEQMYIRQEGTIDPPSPTTQTIDNFERGNLDPYSGAGITGEDAAIVNSPTRSGSHALGYENLTDTITAIESQPGDGLANYPTAGDSFEYYVRGTSNVNDDPGHSATVSFGRTDVDNRYAIRTRHNSRKFFILVFEGGVRVREEEVNLPSPHFKADTWYRVNVDWENNSISARIRESGTDTILGSLTMDNESRYSDGGIAFGTNISGTGESTYYDDMVLT